MRTKIQLATEAAATDHQDTVRGAERDHAQRKALHEVHSGPNPISNSIPQWNWKSDIQRNP